MKPVLSTINLVLFLLLSTVSVFPAADNREFRVINAANGLSDNSAQLVTCTKTGRMIISTLGNVNFYDGTSFNHIDTHQEYQFQLPMYRGNYQFFFDRYHHLWLKNTNSVTCVDLLQEKFIEEVEPVIRDEFGCKDPVQDLFVDSIGDVWLLTEKGLYAAQRKQVYAVLKDRNLQDVDVFEGKWLITFYDDGEEVGMDVETGRVVHRTKAFEWEEAQKYTATSKILRHENGYFQIRNGEHGSVLLHFDVARQQWSVLMKLDYRMNAMAFHNEALYIASHYGYWIYDLKTGETTHQEELVMERGHKRLKTPATTLAFDRQGGLWIGTEQRGLLYAKPSSSPFMVYSREDPEAQRYAAMMEGSEDFSGNFIGMKKNCQYRDSRGWSWFGTTTGLYMYRTPQSEPMVFTKENGLLNNVIHSVVEDPYHNIWLSTSYGISCILFEGQKVVFVNSFNSEDNVPNESFLNGKAICLEDGSIVMMAIDHVVKFHPDAFKLVNDRQPYRLYPKLVRLMVNGNFVQAGDLVDGKMVIDRSITRMRNISLNANQNTITLTFSGLNYFRPKQTFYRVRIKEIDNSWKVLSYYNGGGQVDRNGKLHLPLTSLKPGFYEVEVQASMFPDVWPVKPQMWTIHVEQPWWQSTGMFLLLAFIVLVMIGINFYYFTKNTRMRTRLNSEEGDIIRKVRAFVDRCESMQASVFEPLRNEIIDAPENNLSPEFIALMMRLLPFVKAKGNGNLTMHMLSEAGGVDIAKLYEILSGQLYKNPRNLVRHILLTKAKNMLETTELSVEEIADACGFYSPNYFIGNFFHENKMTPNEYREEHCG